MSPELKGFIWAVGAALLADAADIVSTVVGNWHPRIIESNPLVRDPITHKAILSQMLGVKAIFWGSFLLPLGVAIKKATKSWTFATAPFLFDAYVSFGAAAGNWALLYHVTR